MPQLWRTTIAAHREEVRQAILSATAQLVEEHGLRSLTMSQIATSTGIGRATLYRYFSGVDQILSAWHRREIDAHLSQLTEVGNRSGSASERLAAVLIAYALGSLHSRAHHDAELVAFLHEDEQIAEANGHLSELIRSLISEGAQTGELRDDIPAEELASYSIHALSAARQLPSRAAAQRLVEVTMAGLRGS